MATKPISANAISLDQLKLGAQKCLANQQKKSLDMLSYLIKAQKEVLEFEVGVLEDVLQLLTKSVPSRRN